MTKLSTLRSHIRSLRNRRATARSATAWSAVLLALLWSLLVIFAIDWALSATVLQRVILIAVALGVVAWVYRRKAYPWLSIKETELDVALLVEKKQKIDSDLVAAIQFESPEAAAWGSTQLEDAVVDYVAEFSKGWNVFDGFTREKFAKRALALAGTAAVIAVLALALPGHFGAFLNRLALGSKHYPTDTVIESAKINEVTFKVEPDGEADGGHFPFGRPLKFRITCSGDLPETGEIKLRAANGLATEIEVTRLDESADEGQAVYEGELPRLVDSLECRMYFGDAYTDPRTLFVTPLPIVEATLVGTLPGYAHSRGGESVVRSTAKQFKALEGSQVDVEVVCKNKDLKEVKLVIDRPADIEVSVFPLTATEGDVDEKKQQIWRLSGKNHPPLDEIRGGGVAYHIEVLDENDMRPERAISGTIVAQPDMPPTAHMKIVSNYWVPEARPELKYRVSDDYGVAAVNLDISILRQSADPEVEDKTENHTKKLSPAKILKPNAASDVKPNVQLLDLKPYNLAKGDELTIRLLVTDHRGMNTGVTGTSDSLKLFITDQQHITALALETDKHSLEQTDQIRDKVLPD
jgi:hypothetical protein